MKSLSYLNKYFVKYKWHMLLGILFIVISNYFGVRMPVYVKETIDEFLKGNSFKDSGEIFIVSLKIGGIYMFLSFCSGLFLFFTRQTIIVMSRLIEFDLKNEIYAHYQKLDYSFYKRNNTGDLMNRISEDVSQVRMYLGPGIMYSINLVALFALVIFQMIAISPMLTLFVLLPLPLMSFLIYKVSSKMNELSGQVQKKQSFMATIVQESFSGIRVIKAYNRESEIHHKFNEESLEYKRKTMRLVKVNAFFMPTIIFLIGLSSILAIYIGGLMSYDKTISLGSIVAFIFFVNKLTWPFASIGWVTSINQRAAASQARINEFLTLTPDIENPSKEPLALEGSISFRNVSYFYPEATTEVLKNVNFEMEVGKTYAIIGKTGSGKSTILKLIMRQVDPTQGDVLVDGKSLKSINLEDYRKQTGIVPQEVFLFSDTIANNIRFGSVDNNSNIEEVEGFAKLAHVHHNILDFPDKYDTLLGERGVNLSGGQKQRLSIARALLHQPKLLVLDDCLSAVDTETEEIILSNLRKLHPKPTTLLVSHRISSLRYADQIFVLENGAIVEKGTHEELISMNGLYADMYVKQLVEEKN